MTEKLSNEKASEKTPEQKAISKYPKENFELIDANLAKLYGYVIKVVPDSAEKSQVLVKISEALMWNKFAFELESANAFQPTAEIRNLKIDKNKKEN